VVDYLSTCWEFALAPTAPTHRVPYLQTVGLSKRGLKAELAKRLLEAAQAEEQQAEEQQAEEQGVHSN